LTLAYIKRELDRKTVMLVTKKRPGKRQHRT
jgi:hypothetical protein